jgi:hypothetical protein
MDTAAQQAHGEMACIVVTSLLKGVEAAGIAIVRHSFSAKPDVMLTFGIHVVPVSITCRLQYTRK